jgi:MFS family permease
MSTRLRQMWGRSVALVRHQPLNFKIMLLRRCLHGLALNLSAQYNSIFAVSLGANPVQLGSLLSAGNTIGALIAVPSGWVIDHYSLRRVFLGGTVLLLLSALCYALAPDWRLLYAGIVFLYTGVRVTCTSCTVIGARELISQERATARGLCRTFSAVVTLIAPILAAWLVACSGGINVKGVRPLYYIQLAIFLLIMVILVLFLREPGRKGSGEARLVLSEFAEIFRGRPVLIRMLAMLALMDIPWSMVQPYMPLFAHQFKGAEEVQLAGMAVAVSVASLLFAIPLGKMADRRGRKKLLFLIAPIGYLSSFFLIGATGPMMLYLAGLCFGFHSISIALAAAMASEIVPKKQMGRWIGVIGLIRGLVSVPAPLVAGLVWEHIGAKYVFIFAALLDAAVRLPLLASIGETLRRGEARAEDRDSG